MVHYRLIYFNSRGRAEPIRLIFAYAGIEYEDVRLDHGEKWQQLKPNTPFGQLPVLEIDGKQLAQSITIARFLGKELGLTGKDNLESAKADMLVDGVEDLSVHLRTVFREKDPEKKKELFENVKLTHIDPLLKRYENFLEQSRSGYFITDKVTWADIFLFDAFQKWEKRHPQILDNSPTIKKFVNKISENPGIKQWIETRPETEN